MGKGYTLIQRLTSSLQQMINEILQGIPGDDFVRVMINNHYLHHPIYLPFGRRNQINAETILEAIKNVLNSNEEFLIDGFLEVNVIHVHAPQGGRTQKGYASNAEKLAKKTSVTRVKNKDNMCMARAIVIAKSKIDKDPKWKSIRDSPPMQTRVAKALCQAAGVDHTKVCGLAEAAKFQAYLVDYQLNILSQEHM